MEYLGIPLVGFCNGLIGLVTVCKGLVGLCTPLVGFCKGFVGLGTPFVGVCTHERLNACYWVSELESEWQVQC